MSKGPLKPDFLNIYVTTSFGVRKLKNASTTRISFFVKVVKIEGKFRKCKKKIEKLLLFFKILASENVAINCLY